DIVSGQDRGVVCSSLVGDGERFLRRGRSGTPHPVAHERVQDALGLRNALQKRHAGRALKLARGITDVVRRVRIRDDGLLGRRGDRAEGVSSLAVVGSVGSCPGIATIPTLGSARMSGTDASASVTRTMPRLRGTRPKRNATAVS